MVGWGCQNLIHTNQCQPWSSTLRVMPVPTTSEYWVKVRWRTGLALSLTPLLMTVDLYLKRNSMGESEEREREDRRERKESGRADEN